MTENLIEGVLEPDPDLPNDEYDQKLEEHETIMKGYITDGTDLLYGVQSLKMAANNAAFDNEEKVIFYDLAEVLAFRLYDMQYWDEYNNLMILRQNLGI